MRLSLQTQRIINDTVAEIFGSCANVMLFGSRIDDNARGGDIDLLVKSERPIPDSRRKALQLAARLQLRLGDQPIDILTVDPQTELQAIHKEGLRTGVRL